MGDPNEMITVELPREELQELTSLLEMVVATHVGPRLLSPRMMAKTLERMAAAGRAPAALDPTHLLDGVIDARD